MAKQHPIRAHAPAATVGLCTIAVAAAALFGLNVLEQSRKRSREASAQAAARSHLEERLKRMAADLEMTGHNAGSSPRLVAAVRANVTASTLRDIFESEAWWQPYRDAFPIQALASDNAATTLRGAVLEANAVSHLVAQARATGRATAGFVVNGETPYEAVAAPMSVALGTTMPVLILARPFGATHLGDLAKGFEGAVGLVNKERLIALLGARPASALLRAAPHGLAVAQQDLGGGVRLVARPVDAQPDRLEALILALLRVSVCLIAVLVAGVAFLGRKAAPAVAQVPMVAPAASLGRYAFLDKIGGGGMAEVFLAVARGEQGFKRPCVVKRLRPELADNDTVVAQFTDEATLASSLVHSNIIPIFDFGRVDDQYFIVEEYVPGRDLGRLAQRLRERGHGTLPPEAVAYAACEVLNALEYAHNKLGTDGRPMGLVHRDVSPENIIVSLAAEVKLLDFGVLKARAGRSTKTEVGALKGSVSFMSPEQARCAEVDARADLFSLALVMYFCLTGEALYEGTSSYQILVKAGTGITIDEEQRLAQLPPGLGVLLRHALATGPENRFQTAAEFAAALRPFATDGAVVLKRLMVENFSADLHAEQELLRAGLQNTAGRQAPTAPAPASGRTGTLTDNQPLAALAAQFGRTQ